MSDSKQRLKSIVDAMREGIMVVDRDGKVEWINAQMEELACIQQQALIGRPFTQLFKGIDEDLEQFVVRGQPKLISLPNSPAQHKVLDTSRLI